jgi:hypothetical protein
LHGKQKRKCVKGEMDEAKAAMAEALRLKPDLSVKWQAQAGAKVRFRRPPQGGAAGRMSETRKLAAILVVDVVGSPATRHGAAADARSTNRPPRAKSTPAL